MIVDDGNDLLALLVFVPRVPNPIPPFLATVLVPSPWSTLVSSCFSAARCRTLARNACQSDPSSAHLAVGRDKARCLWYVSSSPPLRTVREAFTSHGSALSDQSWSSLCGKRCRVPVNCPGGLH